METEADCLEFSGVADGAPGAEAAAPGAGWGAAPAEISKPVTQFAINYGLQNSNIDRGLYFYKQYINRRVPHLNTVYFHMTAVEICIKFTFIKIHSRIDKKDGELSKCP